ncbi:MAG: permease [Spirochaetaceae bacterium 4572_7]|nr:MAG: permease [Spirochaetaceae bacterium 4572_7]
MTVIIMIIVTLVLLTFSIIKSRKKSIKSVQIAKKMLLNTFVEVTGVMAIVGLILALIPTDIIKSLLGGESKSVSTILGAAIGTITIMPAFIAFPLAQSLYVSGAHLVAIAAFLTTLTMVGLATFPIEARHFGKKFAIVRNGVSFLMALVIALGMGVIL